ncbi:amino acid permease-domain-containing protein [Phanerochaete sordida]|uniref:Amino acid permease-domain-containing protein n=1 Tax=Phanerochaete sordida TaxID=48140 RepID=A0A9P3LG05_9APHY|nr:amino acid permease-domain-containing protein [Phanerochaete sordida]
MSSRAFPTGLASRASSLRNRHEPHAETLSEDEQHVSPSNQGQRIEEAQKRWEDIKRDLPPQLTEAHSGVIGTGLFLGSGAALTHGGPVGAFLGYFIMGTVVYCLCVSIGEMIAFLPNVGGVVGLADLYVDRALGFSLGWAAWYNWSVTLPAEITAAVIVTGYWDTTNSLPTLSLTALYLALATIINCFPSKVYGTFEYYFSAMKVVTIVVIIVITLVLDIGPGVRKLRLFDTWKEPFAESYLGITGSFGRFLGFWAVLMQAAFSFFGSEVPGIAAGEVIDATRNVPRALRRVYIRITLFYLGGIFCAGLLVRSDDPDLTSDATAGTVKASPFVIAFEHAGYHALSSVINAAVLLSAWSAAASDVYISSRFLFFLARQRHAPRMFNFLLRYPQEKEHAELEDEAIDNPTQAEMSSAPFDYSKPLSYDDDPEDTSQAPKHKLTQAIHVSTFPVSASASTLDLPEDEIPLNEEPYVTQPYKDEECAKPPQPRGRLSLKRWLTERWCKKDWSVFPLIVPLNAVLGSASVGLLAFLNAKGTSAQAALSWMTSVASIASLLSWAGMMFTYIRWYQGTVYAERQYEDESTRDTARISRDEIEIIRKNRHRGQPFLACWAFGMCVLILFTNGWSVFVHSGWRIADVQDEATNTYSTTERPSKPIANFLASYIPIVSPCRYTSPCDS